MKERVLSVIKETKAIAVIRMNDSKKALKAIEAILKGGIRAIEITMTVPYAIELIREIAKNKPEDIVLGAGTVLDSETARNSILAGAEFVVSPITNSEMIKICKRYSVVVIPGAFTPTEILNAWEMGADVVKIFPSGVVGPKYFKDVKGPLPQVEIMPTGGVSIENAADFIKNGACCVGIGSALLDKKAIAESKWEIITEKAKKLFYNLNNI